MAAVLPGTATTRELDQVWRTYLDLPRSVHILCLGMFINRAGSFVLVFLTIYVTRELEAGPAFAAQCMGVFGAGSTIASLVGGQLADQFGRRIVMLGALFGGAAVLVVMSELSDPWQFMLSVGVFGLIVDMYRPACSAMFGDLVEGEQRPHAFGLFYISINLGFAIGPPIGGILAGWSFRSLFLIDAITTAICGLIILAFIPETRSRRESTASPLADSDATAPNGMSIKEAVRFISRDGTFLVLCLATLLGSIVFMQGTTTLPIHMQTLGFNEAEFGLLIAINGLMIFVCQLPLTHALAPYSRMGALVVGEFLIAVGFGITTFAESFGFFALTIVIWTTGEMMHAAYGMTIITDLAPLELRARYQGLISMMFAIALMIGAPLGGIILENFGGATLWIGCGAIGALSTLMHFAIYPAVTRRLPSQTP